MYKLIAFYLFKVIVAGIIIGLLYKQQMVVLILLGLRIIYRLSKYKYQKQDVEIPFVGMILTGIVGTTIEYFGTKHGIWEYHDIDTQLPLYLFFVWMQAFTFMYNIEVGMIKNLPHLTAKQKMLVVLGVVILFPTVGEIMTIYFGVWTYYVPLKFLGVSPYTILAIAVTHLIINYIMTLYCKARNKENIVLNPAPQQLEEAKA